MLLLCPLDPASLGPRPGPGPADPALAAARLRLGRERLVELTGVEATGATSLAVSWGVVGGHSSQARHNQQVDLAICAEIIVEKPLG